MNNKKITQTALFSALALIFGYIEHLFPLPIPVYGAKAGISNIVILASLYSLNAPVAWLIMLIKTLCQSILFSGFSAFLYSFLGGAFSIIIMQFFKKSQKLSIIGVSVAGGVFHNIGQIAAAVIMLKSLKIIYYLPLLIVCGIVAGAIIGIITQIMLKRINIFHL